MYLSQLVVNTIGHMQKDFEAKMSQKLGESEAKVRQKLVETEVKMRL